MYKIYAKRNDQTVCIYNDVMMTEETKALSPHLTLTESNAGELTFKIAPTNNGYGFIERLDTEIIVTKKDVEIWSGRVISSKEDFFKNITYTCEGELAYLNDTIQPQAEYHIDYNAVATFLDSLINEHNKKVKEDKRFHVGVVTVTDPNDYLYRYTNYESTMHDINDKLVDRLGGFIRLRKVNGERYIDYISTNAENGGDMRNTSNQVVQFGDNLLDFTKSFESTEFCTVVLPLGSRIEESEESEEPGSQQQEEGVVVIGEDPETGEAVPIVEEDGYHVYNEEPIVVVEELPTPTPEVVEEITQEGEEEKNISGLDKYVTIESVNNGLPYLINQESYKRFGWIEKVVNFDDVNTPNILKTKGETYLNEAQFDTMVLEVSSVDLGYLKVDVDNIHLSDNVRVVSRPHGLDRYFPVTKISIPLDNPANTTFTMGTEVKVSLSSKTVTGSDAIVNKVNNMISSASTSVEIKQAVDSAKNEAAQMMNMATTGYITTIKTNNGSEELLITNQSLANGYDPRFPRELTYSDGVTKYWRWNSNGLAYYNQANVTANNPTGLVTAWTMDGKFNADVITTGVLRGASNKFYLDMDRGTIVMSDGIFTGSFSAAVGSTFFSANEYGVVWADTYSKKYSDGTMEMYDTDNPSLLRYKWDKTGFVSYGKNYSGSREFEVRYGFSGYFTTEEEITPIPPEVVEIESVGSGSSSEWISNAIAYYQNNQNAPFAIFGLTANSSTLKMINDGDINLKSKNGNISIYTSVNDLYGTIELSAKNGAGRINLDGQVECWNGASGTLTDGYGTRWIFEKGILVNIDNPNNY